MIKRIIIGIIALLVLSVAGFSWWVFSTVGTAAKTTSAVDFTVSKGEGVRAVAQKLYDAHLIDSRQSWTLFVILTGQRGSILPGTYSIPAGASGKVVINTMTANPPNANEVKVTIPEGLKATEIATLLEKAGVVNATEFLAIVQHPASSGIDLTPYAVASQKPTTVDLEGYLFPDTYRFFKHSTAIEVVKKFLANLDLRYTADLRQSGTLAGHTPHQILTMASILEKELKSNSDRAKGADVFWKRITAGMPLQSNVTILYAMGLTEDHLTIADTKFNSPYNTYQNTGLPPGPINNPGLESIKAALFPEANPYYYFLASPTTGITYFAATLEEHNANKAKYLNSLTPFDLSYTIAPLP